MPKVLASSWWTVGKIDSAVANGIARASLWSSRNAKIVVGLTLFLTLGLGYGVTMITTNVDVADVLPRGNPNTEAAQNLTENFRSTFTQQVTFQLHTADQLTWEENNEILEYRQSQCYRESRDAEENGHEGPCFADITDEVYIRAMEEMKNFIQDYTLEYEGADGGFDRTISISQVYALLHWTEQGGNGYQGQAAAPDSAFSLPGYGSPEESANYNVVDQATKAAVWETVDTLASPSWNHGAMLFMPSADNEADMRVLGDAVIAARDAYVEAVDNGETVWTVWGSDNKPLLTVDLPVANAHSSTLVENDMVRLLPIIAAFIIVCLFIAFRNVRAIAISFTALGVGVVWTYGIMGYMGIALNTLNMTIVPLIMGVGIDYSIHMINEFLEHKAHGKTDAEAFQEAGGRAGLAMFIATLTTMLGLIVMMVSPSLLMAQLGFLSAVAIGAIYVITITFIPAALTLLGGTAGMGQSFSPTKIMPALARGVTKARWPTLVLVVLLTGVLYQSSTTLEEEAFGDPGKNFPKDDPVRQEHEQGLDYFYELEPGEPGVKANILVFEGDGVLSPDNVAYMRAIEENLRTKPNVISDTLRTLMFFVETWQTVNSGAQCAAVNLGANEENVPGGIQDALDNYNQAEGAPCSDNVQFPQTEEELESEINDMFASPMRELSTIIINHPSNDMVAMTFSVKAETFDDAAEVWDQIWSAVDAANQQFGGSPPEGVQVAYVGNTATNYLFVEEQLPWLSYMAYASTIILFILVLLFTGDIKATLIATAAAGMTSIWWLGVLPFLDIGLAITLMLPVVFIFNIGTDYVVHLVWNMKKVGDNRFVWETTGKAILFSAITTAGAFAVFIWLQNVAVSRTMVATTVSIGIIFLVTLLVLPIFYKVLKPGEIEKKKIKKEAKKPVTVKAVKRRST